MPKVFLLLAMLLMGGMASAQVVVKGNVYGGGELGKVTENATVTINGGTVESTVYGGGMGSTDDEKYGLVKGNTTVTMTGGMVQRSIYGGGELGSVGTWTDSTLVSYTEAPNAEVNVYVPKVCKTGTGLSSVTVSGGSVGKEGSLMPWNSHNPDDDDRGWVFCGGAGKVDSINYPKTIAMAVVNATHLEISGTALVTASVYGGCENGLVLDSTFVEIKGGQIGTGLISKSKPDTVWVGTFAERYSEDDWDAATQAVKNGTIGTALAEGGSLYNKFYPCDAWNYGDGANPEHYDVYDIFYGTPGYDPENTALEGSNGQSFFGNVFGGGSGYYPMAAGVWRRSAGRVNGNTRVVITGGHILTSVYGGNEVTDVMGKATIVMSGGTVGVPRTMENTLLHPIICYLYGAGKGDQRVLFNKWTNVAATDVVITGGTIFGSALGGGEDGHVLGDAKISISETNPSTTPTVVGTWGYSGYDGNVYGSGRGFSGDALTAGNVGGNTYLTIGGGTILGSVYGGGRNASVGPKLWNTNELLYGQMQPDDEEGTHGHAHVTINGGVIGNDYESKLHYIEDNLGGNVYGGSMGTLTLLDGSLNPMWPRMSKVKSTNVIIDGDNTIIKGNVFGGCKLGTVTESTSVTVKGGTIWRSVYGSGYGSDSLSFAANNVVIVETPEGLDDSSYLVTPRRHAGRVYHNTKVSIEGGWVKQNVYGGGNMASVGTINGEVVVHSDIDSLSIGWPVRLSYEPNTGADTVIIKGGRIGITGNDFMGPWAKFGGQWKPAYYTDEFTGDEEAHELTGDALAAAYTVNGEVYGGGRGEVGERRDMAEMADCVKTVVTVEYPSTNTTTESNFKPNASVSAFYSKYSEWTDYGERGCIVSNLYGAAENGHTHDSTYVTLTNGLIGGSLFGGGKGTDMYLDDLWVVDPSQSSGYHIKEDTLVHSITAGKVYGNTYVTMDGGHVLGNVYGGGEFASVGKGNYLGYGEHSTAGDSTNLVLKSGKCFVTINGGTIGTATWNHNGNVFGSSKGLTYTNVTATPRYNYSRDFFLGYTNFTHVTIGGTAGTGPTILGSVFGGGENGHVRFNTEVTINKGEIGDEYAHIANADERAHRGNVYGAGQGIDSIAGITPAQYCNSAGSVTLNTKVTVNGGTIHRNVYGGGSLASVGPPPTGYNPGTSLNEVIIKGGTIGEVVTTVTEGVTTYSNYGGDVFGAGRGIIDDHVNLAQFATSINTRVILDSIMHGTTPISAANIIGNVYGGGEYGQVKKNTSVNVKAGMVGTIGYTWKHDTDHTDPAVKMDSVFHKTGGSVFGGGRGDLTDPVTNREAALVTDTTHVTISGGHVQYSVYGGGEVASVGLREQHNYKYNGTWFTDYLPKQSKSHADSTGVAMVTIRGGQVGPAPKKDATHNVEIGLNGLDGYVFGGGKGIGEDYITDPAHPYSGKDYYAIADVNNTYVTVDMPMPNLPLTAADTVNRIWGSTFGGAEDGHVLGSARTYYKNGLMGTTGTTTYDGNIFGGGRNYSKKNYNAGRVRVNDSVDMCGGQIFGSIFGGGRLALTGIDLYGNILPDTADVKHGNTFVKVSGGTVGNNDTIEEWIASSMGDVYGAGKGDTIGIYGHPKASALLVSLVKNAEVLITDTVIDGNPRSPRILGSVFGGGEVACVGQFTWNIGEYSGVTNIGDITPVPGTGKTKVTVNGGVIGADKAQMRLDMVDGTGKYDLKYNDDRGHVFGGGEGWVDNPAKYAVVNPSSGTPGIHNNKRLIDLMALVGETQVTIGETARKTTLVKGSVYGGSMNGHVLRDTKVTISGGQIGAGYYVKNNQIVDSLYAENKFFNPITYFGETHTDYDDVAAVDALHGCYRWDYVANNQRPFDPIALKTDPDQTNHSNSKPTNGETWFGNVFGGGSGYYPYFVKKVHEPTVDSCVWNPDAGKVFGHTEVKITGGHILSNVYGGCQTTDVGNYVEDGTTHQLYNNSGIAQSAKAIVTISGGTVGVPETISSIQDFPFMSSVYGGGQGNFRDEHKALNNVDSTRVTISGNALVYGNVFGGSQNAHVLDSTRVLVKGGVVGTTGLSGYDGNVFGGGQGTTRPNPGHLGDSLYAHAGRVGGNAKVVMSDGKALGNLYGGGMVALTGVGLNGWFDEFTTGTTYDSEHHGKAKVELSGGYVGNYFNNGLNLLKSSYASGNVYGAGRGKLDEYDQDDLARSANSAVEISESPTVYGSVFGGGQMANCGYWLGYAGWYATNTATTRVSINGNPTIGTLLEFKDLDGIASYAHDPGAWTHYDTVRIVKYGKTTNDTTYYMMLSHSRTGNVYGGGQGGVKILGSSHRVAGLEQGHCATTNVNIGRTGTPTIRGSVFGGSEQGVIWGETEVHIAGGTIGMEGIVPDSLKYNYATHAWSSPQPAKKTTYSHGNVFGGSHGEDYYSSFKSLNITSPRPSMIDSVNVYPGRVYGNTLVDITGGAIKGNVFGGGNMASVGYWRDSIISGVRVDIVPDSIQGITGPYKRKILGNATVNVSGGEIGPLDGTGLNAYVFGGGKGFANDPTGLRKEYANVDSTFVTVSGGQIWGSVFGGGSDSHVLGSTSVIVHSGANIGIDGLPTWDGNIFGGGRNFQNTNHTNGRVAGNIDINMDGGTLQGSIFGGGRLALTGVNMEGLPYLTTNTATEQVYDSINHGYVHINVTGGSIGNTNGMQLLTGSDESVGDIFGSGKGDTKAYEDIWAGRVAKTKVEVGGTTTRIYGSVFGGGEMASIGYWDTITDNSIPNGTFMKGTGMSEVIISGSPEIGTDTEYSSEYALTSHEQHEWTVFDSNNHNDSILIHTCTGNVFGGCQGDVDPECPAWVSMARSRTAQVTINGGTIKSYVYGGAEQGTVAGNTYVHIHGGTIGDTVTSPGNSKYLFGGVHGGGYGSHRDDYNASTANDSTMSAKYIAGRVYGDTHVTVDSGLIQGDVYGGANYAYIGGSSTKGNTKVYIGNDNQVGYMDRGTTIMGSVYGGNNHAGTPYGNLEVHIISTKHEGDPIYVAQLGDCYPTIPDSLHTSTDTLNWMNALPNTEANYALKAVYGGSNQADYLPLAGKTALVYVYNCYENTIYDVYGGCNAASMGTASAPVEANVIIEGGRIYRVFGGGNGEEKPADIHTTANTEIVGGLISQVFGGSNNNGVIDEINLNINHDGNCPLVIYDNFGGGNAALVVGDVVTTVECGEGTYGNFYGGANLADIYGNVTVNIFGSEFNNLFGGSKGDLASLNTGNDHSHSDIPANIFRFPATIADTANIPQAHRIPVAAYMQAHHEVWGKGGNVTLNIFGGTINEAAFGGSDVNGNIEGQIQVNVYNLGGACDLDLWNLYGASRNTAYTPNYAVNTGEERLTPQVNVIHGTVKGSAFGGGKGEKAIATASPIVNIGYNPDAMGTVSNGLVKKLTAIHVANGYNDTILPASYRDTIKGNVYGGGELAQVDGNTTVNVYDGVVGDSIGRIKSLVNPEIDSVFYGLYAYQLQGGRVFGGGEGSETNKNHGLVTGNATVTMTGGKVYRNVYGGGELASVGNGDLTDKNSGVATVIISGGEVGPLDGSGENAYIYGGGRGMDDDGSEEFAEFANVDSTSVIVCDSARIYGSIFGGGSDGHVLGDARVQLMGKTGTKDTIPVIGTNGLTTWDGNIFGGGRNYKYSNLTAGRVGGNIRIDMTDGELKGNVYGGGRMGLTGMSVDETTIVDTISGFDHGYITVNISGGTIGSAVDVASIGNVFGGGKGIIEDGEGGAVWSYQDLGRVKNTQVNISSQARIYGSVYGGGELAKVCKNTGVTVSGGIIGSELTGPSRYNGSVFGGGKGYYGSVITNNDPGEVWGNSNVLITGGQVMENVYGGGEMGGVGQMIAALFSDIEINWNSVASVTITGGEIGPLDGTGNNGFVYGGGQGKGEDPSNDYILMGDVSNTSVVVSDSALVHASVYGGAAFGHVLGNTHVLVEKGLNNKDKTPLIGTDGMHGYDGNVFGGGQGDGSNFSNGRVGGNTTVEMTHGQVYGNIYGGGRLALTGVDVDGTMQSGEDHGNTKVMVKGGTVGNAAEIVEFSDFSMGNIYGGGKGFLDYGKNNDGTTNYSLVEDVLLLGLTKNTTIEVSDTLGNNTHVYGIILGGGEIANVGKYTLTKDGSGNITNIAVTEGATNVRVGGGIIGGDRSQMRYQLAKPNDPTDWYSKYNDDLGYVYGGGEGWSDNPEDYAWVQESNDPFTNTRLVDLLATVQSTNVTITNDTIKRGAHAGEPSKPWVKASVFGGSESGHVRGNTKVTIAGGQIGAGDNGSMDVKYEDNDFINPVTTEVTTSPTNNTLKGTANWHYEAPHNPYDPAKIRNQYNTETGEYGYKPCDGKSWFGNVFGGGSGWFPYVTGTTAGNFESHWNPLSGKVWGNTEVIITGGHILNNVYGANEMTDVGGKATIKMSGGTVGVPRTRDQVLDQPVTCYVFGGGCGDPRDIFYDKTNVDSTNVQITGGIVYGSVFGGAEDGHIFGDAKVTIGEGEEFTVGEAPNAITYTYPVIGSTGTSSADGNIFGGGRNFLAENYTAGRVGGNIDITMKGGVLLGSIFGGGRLGITGIDINGDMITTDPDDHGNVTINISGGTVGNESKILEWLDTPNHTSMGDVFGGGKGIQSVTTPGIDAYNLARVKNSEVNISGAAKVLGSVFGGGELASVGWYNYQADGQDHDHYLAEPNTGLAKVNISGGQVGVEQAGQAEVVGANVFGGGLGIVGGKAALPFANVDSTKVNISGNAYIVASVFGGGDKGHVTRSTNINISGGTVGKRNTLYELFTDSLEQAHTHIYTGSVLAGGRGTDTQPDGTYNDTTGLVFGNANVTVGGNAVVRHAVYGGGGLSSVGTFVKDANEEFTFIKGGKTYVTVRDNALIGPTKEDLTNGYTAQQIDSAFKYLGGNAGWVFGAGCGMAGSDFSKLTYNDSTFVRVYGDAQVVGSVYGGGENAHVHRNTDVNISGGTIGGVPLHGDREGTDPDEYTIRGGVYDGVTVHLSHADAELYEDEYGYGRHIFRGVVYGGGKGTDTVADPSSNYVFSPTAGRVFGNTKVTVSDSALIYNRVYGGGLIASIGNFEYYKNALPAGISLTDSIQRIHYINDKGVATINIKGGTIGTDGRNNGDVVGGGRGIVGRPIDTINVTVDESDQVVHLAYVRTTNVNISQEKPKYPTRIKSNVYGGSINGSVHGDAHVTVTGGTIGDTLSDGTVCGGWHSNVYGGGGGSGRYKLANGQKHLSIVAGRVFGNTTVEISGGTVFHNVYGGGAIASVGTYDLRKAATNPIVPGTANTVVTITGDNTSQTTIGKNGNENGMVFGSGRGEIDAPGAYMDSLSYAANATVNIGTLGSTSVYPKVKGSVYGSGENGHVFLKATVNVNSGTVGCESYEADHFALRGNVYGAGCGTDKYNNNTLYNPIAGIVQGNTEVNIKGGHISHNVYGGGAMAMVGSYTFDGSNINTVSTGTGKAIVNVSGGTIGTSNAPSNVNHGDVYGGARGTASDEDGFTDKAIVDSAYVNISGGDVLGSVYGGGAKSLVHSSRVVNISGGTVHQDVYGGSNDSLKANTPFVTLKTVNVSGGTVNGNVFGCSHNAIEGDSESVFTSFVNITGGTIDHHVFAAGNGGEVNGSVCLNIGKTAVDSTQNNTGNRNVCYNRNGYGTYTLTPKKLIVRGNVYGGSHHFGTTETNQFNKYDIEGFSVVAIDGTGYDTRSTAETSTYMNIASGIIGGSTASGVYGCGAHSESGKSGREIIIRNYGERNNNTNGQLLTATRDMTTIQRGGVVLLDDVNINLSGAVDINQDLSNPTNTKKFGMLRIDNSLMIADSSSIVLGTSTPNIAPAFMDSIKQLASLQLKEGKGSCYSQMGSGHNSNWYVIGINNNDNKLYRIDTVGTNHIHGAALTYQQENVIIFNDTSKLWVRYRDNSGFQYGELLGFFRMLSPLSPYGTRTFAEARPKLTVANGGITSGSTPVNDFDGGFLSYDNANNFYAIDGGQQFTNTKQYPYTNVLVTSKDGTYQYREWLIRMVLGNKWYVDGRTIGNFNVDYYGKDTKESGRGLYPDLPKQTITRNDASSGYYGIYAGTRNLADNADVAFNQEKDAIYVVGPVNGNLENTILNNDSSKPLKLYRYPGSSTTSGDGQHHLSGTTSYDPSPNYGALVEADTTQTDKRLTLNNVSLDGLFGYSDFDDHGNAIPSGFNTINDTMPLVVTYPNSILQLEKGTVIKNGYNHKNAEDWYIDSDYKPSVLASGLLSTYHGAAIYVDSLASVYVSDSVLITGNKQFLKIGSTGPDQVIESNVYLPTFSTQLYIADSLYPTTSIGITSPKRNRKPKYVYNTLSPVAYDTVTKQGGKWAEYAWRNCNFYDDQNWFFVNGHTTASPRTTYRRSDDTYTLYFGWTWANVVRQQPTGFALNNINSAEDMAWLISQSASMNGQTATNFEGETIKQTADLNMGQYVWVPIGDDVTDCLPFAGTYDGQGHTIDSVCIEAIGIGDRRYERNNYGLFGRVAADGTVTRTFLVGGKIQPAVKPSTSKDNLDESYLPEEDPLFDDDTIMEMRDNMAVTGPYNIGGLVGYLDGGTVCNSEAAVIVPFQVNDSLVVGGLVGQMADGQIHSSMAMPYVKDIQGDAGSNYCKGLVGGLVGHATSGKVENSFANLRVGISGATTKMKIGGLVGHNTAKTRNSYVILSLSGQYLTHNNFGSLAASNPTNGNIDSCYVMSSGNYRYILATTDTCGVHCGKYQPVINSNNLGYMCADNRVVKGTGTDITMFQLLNHWVDRHSGHTYSRWARPGITEVNNDLPVLLLDEFDGASDHKGKFRSVATYNRNIDPDPVTNPVLQYGGPARDGVGNDGQLEKALVRMTEKNSLFIYGDIDENEEIDATIVTTNTKVSIQEDVAIMKPGSLAAYTNTYVGITFDNSYKNAYSTPGLNNGLGVIGAGGYLTGRDWHMFSSPLSNAPLGFDYSLNGTSTNTNTTPYPADGSNHGNYYHNPWVNSDTEFDFDWLTTPGSAECYSGTLQHHNRYWMKNDVDGYFPYYRGTLFSDPNQPNKPKKELLNELFVVDTDRPSDECLIIGNDTVYRYPYGMDFYTWNEPTYHWINFKRNGPNHWHSDTPHVHLDYQPKVGAEVNQNEDNLIPGRGYMAAIMIETLLQSHGNLNSGDTSIMLTKDGYMLKGWNLVGNPYHGYLDFNKLANGNKGVFDSIAGENGDKVPFYVVYDADSTRHDRTPGFIYYPQGGSVGGAYAGRFLHPHQGFYVKTKKGGTLKFNESMLAARDTVTEAGWGIHFRGMRPAYPLVNLYLSSDHGCNDVTVIEFNRPETGGAPKLKELRVGNGLFYTHFADDYYAALFTPPGIDRVPLWFEAKEDDIYTITWDKANGDFHSMWLIDNIAGVQYDMLRNDTYSFEGHVRDYPSRFLIVFDITGLEDSFDINQPFAFHDGDEWVVTGDGTLQFVDVLGHILKQESVHGQTRMALPKVANGVYMFRLMNDKGVKMQKVIISNYGGGVQ